MNKKELIKITKQEHNSVFINRIWTWKNCFVYTNENGIIEMTEYYSKRLVLLETILLPFTLIVNLFYIGIRGIMAANVTKNYGKLYKRVIRVNILDKDSLLYQKLANKGLFNS